MAHDKTAVVILKRPLEVRRILHAQGKGRSGRTRTAFVVLQPITEITRLRN